MVYDMVKDSIIISDSPIFICGTAFLVSSYRIAVLPHVSQGGFYPFYHFGVVQADIWLAFVYGGVHNQILKCLLLCILDIDCFKYWFVILIFKQHNIVKGKTAHIFIGCCNKSIGIGNLFVNHPHNCINSLLPESICGDKGLAFIDHQP